MCHVIPNAKDLSVSAVSGQNLTMACNFGHAKDETAWGNDYSTRGYITSFTWQPQLFSSRADEITSFGTMPINQVAWIDVIAYPTNVWRLYLALDNGEPAPNVKLASLCCKRPAQAGMFGVDDTDCDEYSSITPPADCTLKSFAGATYPDANGFRLRRESAGVLCAQALDVHLFSLALRTPAVVASACLRVHWKRYKLCTICTTQAVNAQWTATSYEMRNGAVWSPYTVILDRPITIVGQSQERSM
eukprot:2740704-Amphidinium_carterae.1